MTDTLASLLTRIRDDKYLHTGVEEVTRQAVILPILQNLGWDRDNPREVVPEYAINPGRIDYCLMASGVKHVFIEVKRANEPLEQHAEQLLNYAFRDGVKLAVLTNGTAWWFYLPLLPGSWEQRKFYAIDIQHQGLDQVAQDLRSFLGRISVIDGSALRNAEEEYYRLDKARIIGSTLPSAWQSLCTGPDELLVELLAEKVESLCGHRPDVQVVAEFLMRCASAPDASSGAIEINNTVRRAPRISTPKQRIRPLQSSSSTPRLHTEQQDSFQNTRPLSYSLMGSRFVVSTFQEIWLGVAQAMHHLHPDTFEQVMTLRGRHRSYFSRNRAQLKAPKLVNSTDIYAETNLSANHIIRLIRELLLLFNHATTDLRVEAEPKFRTPGKAIG